METMQKVKLALAVVVAIVVLIVVFQNTHQAELKILFLEPIKMPSFLLLLMCLAIGFGLGWLSSALWRRKRAKAAQE